MTDKYVCLMDGCDFVAQSKKAAFEHSKLDDEHIVVKVGVDEEEAICRQIESNYYGIV